MNNNRRKQIEIIVGKLEEIHSEIEILKDEENEYFESVPENMTEKKERAEASADGLDRGCDEVLSAIDSLNEAVND